MVNCIAEWVSTMKLYYENGGSADITVQSFDQKDKAYWLDRPIFYLTSACY